MFRDLAIRECIDVCVQAQLEAEQCAAISLAGEEVTDLRRCIQLCRDTANVCALAVHFLAHNSDFAQKVCELCVEICVACRDECAKHEFEHCQRCADLCHRAAEKCEKLTLQPL
ncbi:MAG: four-helix bundle copper-binding protein [Limisphaerales bacterium]